MHPLPRSPWLLVLLAAAACSVAAPPPATAPPPTGDAKLDALRHWASAAPIEDFVRVWNPWWGEFWFEYPLDPVLWRGVDRLAAWAQAHADRCEFDLLSALVMASQAEPCPSPFLLGQRAALRAQRTARRERREAAANAGPESAPGLPPPQH